VNPHDELQSLIDMFPDAETLLADAEHVASQTLPEPYRRMLAHNHHMTVTMESYHGCPVDVRILDRRLDGDFYDRKIILLKHGTDHVVQFGLVRFDLSYVTQGVRDEIIDGQKPLGRVLIDHNVLRHIDLGAVLRITAGRALAEYLQMPLGGVTYGRLATIFCNQHPAVDLLEITAPLPLEGDGRSDWG
jgi:chorismate-pyruvate lyase